MPDLRSRPRTRYGGIQKVLKVLNSGACPGPDPGFTGMTILIEGVIYKQTLTNLLFLAEYLWFYLKEPTGWMETLVK